MLITGPLHLEPKPTPPQAIRDKTRRALERVALEGIDIAQACEEEDVAEWRLPTILAKPEVRAYLEALKTWRERRDHLKRMQYLANAIDIAHDIAENSKDDDTRLRAVKFLRDTIAPPSRGKGAPQEGAKVQINQNFGPSAPGYDFGEPPRPATDTTSDALDVQDAETVDELPED